VSSFSQEALLQVAQLARLDITHPKEQREDMERIVTMVEKIEAIDTTTVLPMAHPLDMKQPLRPDVVTETITKETRALYQSVSAAPTQEGLYLVPKVIE